MSDNTFSIAVLAITGGALIRLGFLADWDVDTTELLYAVGCLAVALLVARAWNGISNRLTQGIRR